MSTRMAISQYASSLLPSRFTAPKLLTLLAASIALGAPSALSQSAMTPGGGAMAPQQRVAPAPQAPLVAPRAPLVTPGPSVAQPGPTNQPQKILRVINNSETDNVKVDAVTGSNRDHIDQDAQRSPAKSLTPTNGWGGTGGGR